MDNSTAWEHEYQNPQFLTLGTEPLSEIRAFIKWMRRKQKIDMANFTVLDLGCGNGKNLKYVVETYAKKGIGYDIAPTAIIQAKKLAEGLPITYEMRSIADPFPVADETIDLVLDVTASNSLDEEGRGKFLKEISRALKPGSYCFTRAPCKDGDDNAKNLIKQFPGSEKDTYVLAETGITERVFSRQDFIETYSSLFEIINLEKATGYQRWGNQRYKRNYWIAYLKIKK